eukprot:763574-Hanusia_phi.AAC.10
MEECRLEKCAKSNEEAILQDKVGRGRKTMTTEHLDMVEIFTPSAVCAEKPSSNEFQWEASPSKEVRHEEEKTRAGQGRTVH